MANSNAASSNKISLSADIVAAYVFSACSFGTVKDKVRRQQTQASLRSVRPHTGYCRNTVATIAAS